MSEEPEITKEKLDLVKTVMESLTKEQLEELARRMPMQEYLEMARHIRESKTS